MEPWGWLSGWEEEIRKRVAAARHHLLSEFYEATTGMTIPFWSDLQAAGVLEGIAAPPYHCFASIPFFGLPRIMYCEPRIIEAEQIRLAIEELRYKIWEYRMWGKKQWGDKTWAVEYGLAKNLEPVLDRATKFLSAGKTTLHGHAQTTKGRNTRVVNHEPEDDCLDANSDEMIQFSEKTSPKRNIDIMNGCYAVCVANYLSALDVRRILKCFSMQNYIAHPYESGRISEKPKPQSSNTVSACKDVHGLTGAEPENYCVFLASTDPIDKMEFPRFHWEDITRRSWAYSRLIRQTFIQACSIVHVDLLLIQINTCIMGMVRDIDAIEDVTLHKDKTSVKREASSFVQFSVETSPKGGVDIMLGSYKIHVLKYCSVHRPIVQLPPSARIMECVTVPYIVVDRYETGHTYEKPKPQSANTGSAFKDVHGLTDTEPENHGMFLASTDPIDKMEGQPWRDCTLMSWAARQILVLACLYASVMFTLHTWTMRILEDPTDPLKYEDQTSFVGSKVRTIRFFYIPRVIHVWLIYAPKFQSVHHRPLIQTVPFACTLYDGTLACAKSIVPKSIIFFCGEPKSIIDLYELGCINQKPNPQSSNPNVDKLTHAELENHGAPDSEDCRITEAEDKITATWLIDTGAVHHATGKLSLLSGVTTVNDNDLFITARDGVRMRVHAQGSVVTDTVVLPDVWYIPGLTKNVVSASQLNQLGYSIGFTRGTCFIRSATDGTLIGKGHVSDDGLFEMDFLKVS